MAGIRREPPHYRRTLAGGSRSRLRRPAVPTSPAWRADCRSADRQHRPSPERATRRRPPLLRMCARGVSGVSRHQYPPRVTPVRPGRPRRLGRPQRRADRGGERSSIARTTTVRMGRAFSDAGTTHVLTSLERTLSIDSINTKKRHREARDLRDGDSQGRLILDVPKSVLRRRFAWRARGFRRDRDADDRGRGEARDRDESKRRTHDPIGDEQCQWSRRYRATIRRS